MHRPEYEMLEDEPRKQARVLSETSAGAVKHNGYMGLDEERLPGARGSGHAAGAKEPAPTMANNLLKQEDTDTEETAVQANSKELLDVFMGKAFEEKPIWVGLWESIRDVFFPPKLPPLKLTSTPIPVPDRMAVKPNPWAIGISTTVNVAILAVLLFLVGKKIIDTVKPPTLLATNVEVTDYNAPKANQKAGGGGGGGDHSMIDPEKGKLPKLEKNPIVAPQVQTVEKPKIPMEAAINVQKDIILPDNPFMTNIGVKNSANVRLASNGQGSGGGMGTGSGGGLGSGDGNGYGPGRGGNTGGGLYRVGGRVSGPVPLFQPEAEFSDEARRAKYQGVCLVGLIVDAQGNPQNVHIVRALGMGLDEKALEAVRKYKFRPAMLDGRTPVPVPVNIEVNFRLY